MGYTYLTGDFNGDTGANYVLEVNVMGCKYASSSALDSAYAGIQDALQEVYDNTDVVGTIARKYETDNALDCDNHWDDGNTWLDNNGFNGDGVYLWVTNCGLAVSASWGGWENRRQAFVSTDWYGEGQFLSVMAIQEGLHSYLKEQCSYVQDLTDGTDDEHALGDLQTINGTQKSSPLAATYVDDGLAGKGDCNDDGSANGGTRSLTWCTRDGLEYSRDHAKNDGSH